MVILYVLLLITRLIRHLKHDAVILLKKGPRLSRSHDRLSIIKDLVLLVLGLECKYDIACRNKKTVSLLRRFKVLLAPHQNIAFVFIINNDG